MKKSVLVQFLRNSGFWLTTRDDVNIIIDPVLSSTYENIELVPPPFRPTAVEKADVILITHLHPDHFDMETIDKINATTRAKVIAHPEVIAKATLSKKYLISVDAGDTVTIKSTKIHAIGLETIKWWDGEIEMVNMGYRIETEDGISLFHSSDSVHDFTRDAEGTDILFFRFGYTPREREEETRTKMIQMIKKIRPRYVVPMHYGTFTSLRADPEEIRNDVEDENTKMLVFHPGQVRKIQLD